MDIELIKATVSENIQDAWEIRYIILVSIIYIILIGLPTCIIMLPAILYFKIKNGESVKNAIIAFLIGPIGTIIIGFAILLCLISIGMGHPLEKNRHR